MPATYTYDAGTDSYFVTGGCGDATITIPDTYNDGTNGTKNVTRINPSAFLNCTSLTSIILGNNIQIIGNSAFKGCTNLSSVTFPTSSLTSIHSSAFWGTALVNVVIPNSVTILADSVFVDCVSLASLTLPPNGTKISASGPPSAYTAVPQGLCVNCTSLTSINIPSSYSRILQDAFIFAGLQTLTLNEGLTQIDDQAFYDCPLIGTLTIPNSVFRIFARAFEKTGPNVYSPPGSRLDIIFGTGIQEIWEHCFWESNVNSISFNTPSALDYIGPGAFNSCTDLENLYLPDTPTLNIEGINLDPSCAPYYDSPFYNAIKPEGTLRIPNGYSFEYTIPNIGPPCFRDYAYDQAALGSVLNGVNAKNIIIGKSITTLTISGPATQLGDLVSIPTSIINQGKSITFEGKISFIGGGTFLRFDQVEIDPFKLYFLDFADSLIIENSAFGFYDQITLPEKKITIN